MSDKGLEAALAYEELFVPALFQEWAPRIVEAVAIKPGNRVLDVACGTGAVTRELVTRVGSAGQVSAIDLAPGMVAIARRKAPTADIREGNAQALPWPDASFDAVVCQFGLMFFADRVQAVREMLRVLAPGGRLAISTWAPLADTPAYADELALIERIAGPAAGVPLRAPFALSDRAELARLLVEAGASSVDVTTHPGTGNFPSIRTMIEADLRGWMPLNGVVLDEPVIEKILAEAETALAKYVTADGTMRFASPGHIATGAKT